MLNQILTSYLQTLQQHLNGQRHNHACQQALRNLLAAGFDGLTMDWSARRAQAGAPDAIIWRGSAPVVCVFVVALNTSLNTAEAEPVFRERTRGIESALLTNYLEFRWYIQGEQRASASAGALADGRIQERGGLATLFQAVAQYQPPRITSAGSLALLMGDLAHNLRDMLLVALAGDDPDPELAAQMALWEPTGQPALPPPQLADIYAQAIACVLFMARVRHRGAARQQAFNVRDVYWNLPPTSPFLRAFFQQMHEMPLDERLAWLVDVLAAALARTDTDKVLGDFSRRYRHEDPITRFYDAFRSRYAPHDPELPAPADAPEPVVSYIVRSADHVLRKRLRRALGLADESLLVVQPVTGSGMFLHAIIQQVHDIMRQQEQLGAWDIYVRDHLLPRLVGYEPRLAAYAITHMKLAVQLQRLGYSFASGQRLRVYLSQPLPASPPSGAGRLAAALADEISQGHHDPGDYPLLLVVGSLLRSPAGDAPRLLRQSVDWLGQHEAGVLAVVTPAACLDSPAFADLRAALLRIFTTGYVLNLHGATGETGPEDTPDEPLFDSAQGAAISIFVRRPDGDADSRIHYADWWGRQADKHKWLLEHDVADTDWQRLHPAAPHYPFIPQAVTRDLKAEYEQGWPLDRVFPVGFDGLDVAEDALRFSLEGGQHVARQLDLPDSHAQAVLYRPFDLRYSALADLARGGALHLRTGDNLALCLNQHISADDEAGPVLCVSASAHRAVMTGAARLFPLYLYPQASQPALESPFPPGRDNRRPNLNHRFILTMANRLHMTFIPQGRGDLKYTFGPEDVFDYAHAVLHSAAYRARYAAFLPQESPRLPLTSDKRYFRALVKVGHRLTNLYLMRKAGAWSFATGFAGAGRGDVAEGYPLFIELAGENGGRVYINEHQYLTGVDRKVWKYQAGGYAVLQEWLAGRQGRPLDWVDLRRCQQIIIALGRILQVAEEIDELVAVWSQG
jgi:hypothetical protein